MPWLELEGSRRTPEALCGPLPASPASRVRGDDGGPPRRGERREGLGDAEEGLAGVVVDVVDELDAAPRRLLGEDVGEGARAREELRLREQLGLGEERPLLLREGL